MFSHVQLNVADLNRATQFYLSALSPLGFQKADGIEGEYVRLTNGRDAVIVLCPVEKPFQKYLYHRKGVGLGHIAIAVNSRQLVDQMAVHLAATNIPLLGEGKVEIDYRRGYYTLAFEDPERIMIEIVYHDSYYFSLLHPDC